VLAFAGIAALAWPASARGELVDSIAWQARFESWVETELVRDQLLDAAEQLPERDPRAALRALDEIVASKAAGASNRADLPSEAVPRIMARGLQGRSMVAARLYARGKTTEAFELLSLPELSRDAFAAHLRAQLIDDAFEGDHPLDWLEVIDQYRFAIALDRKLPQTQRARIRIAQLYLDIDFNAEAMSTLKSHVEAGFAEPFATSANLTLSEAAARAGRAELALEALDRLDLDRLSPTTRIWAQRRRGDMLFQLERFDDAAVVYRGLLATEGEVEGDSLIRMAYAMIEQGSSEEIEPELIRVLHSEPPHGAAPMAGLLLTRAAERRDDVKEVGRLAATILQRFPGAPESLLAGSYLMEAQRIARVEVPIVPAPVMHMLQWDSEEPADALLAYEAALVPEHGTAPSETRARLARLVRSVRPGSVRSLIYGELSRQLTERIARAVIAGKEPDEHVLDEVVAHLSPETAADDQILLVLEGLFRAGRTEQCSRWATGLTARDVRAVRRGIGEWRHLHCSYPAGPEGSSRLIIAADTGKAGPFSLALGALGAERAIEAGDLERASRIYSRSLESFAEPRVLGPVLLRIGEIEAELGRDALATRHLVRGLALTDSAATAADPLRKTGIVVLADVTHRRNRPRRLVAMLEEELRYVGPWWDAAYRYLGYRAGSGEPPTGDNLFAEAAKTIKRIEKVEAHIRKIVRAAEEREDF